jgi:hypothetical protein
MVIRKKLLRVEFQRALLLVFYLYKYINNVLFLFFVLLILRGYFIISLRV